MVRKKYKNKIPKKTYNKPAQLGKKERRDLSISGRDEKNKRDIMVLKKYLATKNSIVCPNIRVSATRVVV